MAEKKITAPSPKTAKTAGAVKDEAAVPATPVELLQAARALIATPEAWTVGANARAASGARVAAEDPGAVCWCADGALIRANHGSNTGAAYVGALRFLQDEASLGDRALFSFNDAGGYDKRRHPAILAWFDCAIARALKGA